MSEGEERTKAVQQPRHGHAGENNPFADVEHPQRRLFLEAFCKLGTKVDAAKAIGISEFTPYSPAWKRDEAFQRGLEIAEQVAADKAEREAWRRGVEGLRRYQFSRKTDEPLLHPEECTCGAPLSRHVEADSGRRPCPETGCGDFTGRPYYEVEYSDAALMRLLVAYRPAKFSDRLQVRGLVAKLDFSQLPDVAVARIAEGEDPQAVLASVLEAGGEDAERVRRALPKGSKVGGRHRAGGQAGELVQEKKQEPPTSPTTDLPDDPPELDRDGDPPVDPKIEP